MQAYRIKEGCAPHADKAGTIYQAGDEFTPSSETELDQLRFKLEEVPAESEDDVAEFDGPWDEETLHGKFNAQRLRKLASALGAGTTGNKGEIIDRIIALKNGE